MGRNNYRGLFTVLVSLLAVTLLALLPACGGTPATTPTPGGNTPNPTAVSTGVTHYRCIDNQMGSVTSQGAIVAAEVFKKWNEAIAKYNVVIDYEPHYGWELFPGTQSIEAVSRNSIQMSGTMGYSEEDFEPRFALSSMPALFTSKEHIKRFYESPEWKKLEADQEAKGTKIMWKSDYNMYLGFKPKVRTLENLKGLRIRGMESPTMMAALQALGAKPLIVSMNELTFAMQTGMIDGLIHSRAGSYFRMLRYHEFMTCSVHFPITWTPNGTAFSTKWWNTLPQPVKDEFMKLVPFAIQRSEEIRDTEIAEGMDIMNKAGIEQIDLTKEEFQRWYDALQPARDLVEKKVGKELMAAAIRTAFEK